MSLGDNLVVTLSLDNFENEVGAPNDLSYSIVLDTQGIKAKHDPEMHFQTIKYVVERMLEDLHKTMTDQEGFR
jgi:hypothetical protein